MKFRKKPIEIEAIQFNDHSLETITKIKKFCPIALFIYPDLIIQTLEGDMYASYGDWIIKGVQDEFYPCKPDIFELTYERVTL